MSTTTDTGRAGRVMDAVGAVQLIGLSGRRQLEFDLHVGRVKRLEVLLGARQVCHIVHPFAHLDKTLVPGVQLDKDAGLIGAWGEACKYSKMFSTAVRCLKLAASADCVLARLLVEAVESV